MYCGDHDALRLPERGVRAVRARERAAARHVPEHDQVRGRDHRHDPRPAARRRGHRRRAGRPRHLGRHRQHPARGARLPRARGADSAASTGPTSSSPRPRTPRSTRRATCSASSCGDAPVDPDDHAGRRRLGRATTSTTNTIAIVGSAVQLRLRHDRPDRRARPTSRSSAASACTSTAASAGSSSRSARSSATTSRCSTSASPASRRISADTHKYGYGFKGTSVLAVPRQGAAQRPVLLPDRLDAAASTARRASRARARAGCSRRRGRRWCSSAARATAATPRQIFETAFAMQDAVRSHPELRIIGHARRSASASRRDEFDIYHVNDFMRTTGWRFNGQQYPNAIHMAVTRPQTQPGVAEAFADRPRRRGRVRQRAHGRDADESGAIYGGVAGGMTDEADEFIRVVMADMLDKQQPPLPDERRSHRATAAATSSFVLAVDLGTGGPKVGLVSLTGAIAVAGPPPGRAPTASPGGGADAGRRASGGTLIVDAARQRAGRRAWSARAGRGGRVHRPVGEHRPGRRRRACRSATACCGMDTRGGRPHAEAHRRAAWPGYAPRALATLDPPHRRRAVDHRGRPDRPHALPRARASPRSQRPARWYLEPVDYLSMRFTGVAAASHASMAGAWLTDNRRPRPPRLRPRAGRRSGGVDAREAAAARGHRLGRRARCCPRWPPSSASPPASQVVVAGTPDLHSAALGAGAVLDYEAHLAISTTLWISCPVPFKKTDVIRQIATRPRPHARPLPRRQQPRDRRRRACSGCATTSPRRRRRPPVRTTSSPRWRPRRAAGQRRRHLHAVAHRRAVAGRRPHARGRLPQPVARHRPAPTLVRVGARGRGLQHPLAARGGREVRRSAGSTRSGSSAAAPLRPVVPDPRRRAWTARSSGSPSPCTPTSGAPRCSPRLALGRGAARRGARPGERGRDASRPTPPTAAVYDRLYAEFPASTRPEDDVPPPQPLLTRHPHPVPKAEAGRVRSWGWRAPAPSR